MKEQIKILVVSLCSLIVIGVPVAWWFGGWTAYKSYTHGFEISFPRSFIIMSDHYSPNDENFFSFTVKDSEHNSYIKISAYTKPADYHAPEGPFPHIVSNEKLGSETYPGKLNNISGFKTSGAVEGGGGDFEIFEFEHEGKVWNIEFLGGEELYYKDKVDQEIFEKIKQSFALIESS